MIRVVSYNLSGVLDAGALTEVLASIQPDVVCVMETPGRFALGRLASRVGLAVAARAGRRRLGVGVLTGERTRVINATDHRLSAMPGLARRPVAQAIVAVGGVRLATFAVQLGLRPEVRETDVRDFQELLAKINAPRVVGADLNEAPGGPSVQRLSEVLVDAFAVAGEGRGETFPNPDPLTRKDFLFVERSFALLRAWVPVGAPVEVASHHRPVVVEIAEAAEQPLRHLTAEDPAA